MSARTDPDGTSKPLEAAPQALTWAGRVWRVIAETGATCVRYRVTGLAAEAAFFGVLSLPPLLFGLVGTIGFIVGTLDIRTISGFREQLREAVGPGLPRLLSCDFSTSTDVERMAGDVVLMDTLSPYFDFVMACLCGIPRITLLGTPEDWRSIRARLDVIA